MTKLSMQEYLDKSANYLRNQKQRCCTPQGQNRYKWEDNRCVIGAGIPDTHEALNVEWGVVLHLLERYPDLSGVAWPLGQDGPRLARYLQMLHDGTRYRKPEGGGLSEQGEQRLEWIANKYNLIYSRP